MDAPPPFRVLVLCAHNRTRSVMAGHLLQSLLANANVEVTTAGFGEPGRTAMPQAVELLENAGIHAHAHRSTQVTPQMVREANLVLTAEKSQVMAVVADLGGDFDRTFTLPEYARSLHSQAERPRGLAYMKANVPEVDDPTGHGDTTWRRVWGEIEGWCRVVARAVG
jgi:protein-tyrosine-phosphatase